MSFSATVKDSIGRNLAIFQRWKKDVLTVFRTWGSIVKWASNMTPKFFNLVWNSNTEPPIVRVKEPTLHDRWVDPISITSVFLLLRQRKLCFYVWNVIFKEGHCCVITWFRVNINLCAFCIKIILETKMTERKNLHTKKSKGLRIDPCGTPYLIWVSFGLVSAHRYKLLTIWKIRFEPKFSGFSEAKHRFHMGK